MCIIDLYLIWGKAMELFIPIIIAFLIMLCIFVPSYFIYLVLRSPFKYPYYNVKFDVTGRRNPDIDDLIDSYIIQNGMGGLQKHFENVRIWERKCEDKIDGSLLRHLRRKQFDACLDNENMFCFILLRNRTKYVQENYVRTPYKEAIQDREFDCSYDYLVNRYEMLRQIGFECTVKEYYSKNQRKLMTKELRKEIMERDNYTCRICGKYMPDEVGLHIDHIVPVAKGGKTVRSNLQVLCSKCNGRKSDR